MSTVPMRSWAEAVETKPPLNRAATRANKTIFFIRQRWDEIGERGETLSSPPRSKLERDGAGKPPPARGFFRPFFAPNGPPPAPRAPPAGAAKGGVTELEDRIDLSAFGLGSTAYL